MRLVELHEDPMMDIVDETRSILKDHLADEGYYAISDTLGLGGLAYVRVLDPIMQLFIVTLTIQKDKWPIIPMDAGMAGVGLVERDQIDFNDPDALKKLSTFTSRFVRREGEDTEALLDLADQYRIKAGVYEA